MSRTVTRLFNTHTEALTAVRVLEAQGVDHDRISVIANNSDNWHNPDTSKGFLDGAGDRAERLAGSRGDLNRDGENDVAEGAGKGATTGGLLGGGAGLLAGLGMLAIPGLGPVVAVGWLASAAVGAVVGAIAGGATGGLLGALKEAGHSDEEANVYAEGVRRGGALVSVRADDDDAVRIEGLLAGNRGVDAMTRGAAYRASGWTTFEPSAEPYSPDQIARERQQYSEDRSFAGSQPSDLSEDGVDRARTEQQSGSIPSRPL
ncbi:MAG: hypothetical protein V4466_02865 [Pseudomonadota bacterium]